MHTTTLHTRGSARRTNVLVGAAHAWGLWAEELVDLVDDPAKRLAVQRLGHCIARVRRLVRLVLADNRLACAPWQPGKKNKVQRGRYNAAVQ